MQNQNIRSPIITVVGHVDHGKTSLLDNIRKTGVQETEAGGITQKISFTRVPIKNILVRCPLIKEKGIALDFPGFLFIDTPGHAAFSHLRKHGGTLADLAILVIDINEGLKPQTIEVLHMLKLNKVPFIIALNKIDNISGWRTLSNNLTESVEKQSPNVKIQFDEKVLTIVGTLYYHGLHAKLFYEIKDFTKELAIVPVSAKTGEGIPELILMLCGLSQRFLKEKLRRNKDARGVILEIKKEKTMEYIEAILFDGTLAPKDEIAIASFDEPIISTIRVLEEIEPASIKFKPTLKVTAAAGIRIQLVDSQGILPGMPFTHFKNNISTVKKEFKKDFTPIQTDNQGIIVKADSLGSLQALMTMLKQERINVGMTGIGTINKKDLVRAKANLQSDKANAIIVGFNVEMDEELKNIEQGAVKILTNQVIYKLIEDLIKIQKEVEDGIKKERLMKLATISKIKILPQFVFRNSNPAVFGVRIEAGKIKKGIPLMNNEGEQISRIKDIQEEKNSVDQSLEGKEVAISLPGVNFERQLKRVDYLYSDMSEGQFKKFKENKDLLTKSELQTLQKIAEIKKFS